MIFGDLVSTVADVLKQFDSELPVHKTFKAGIGPFGEPQLIKEIARRLSRNGLKAKTGRTPDLDVQGIWALEFKIIRPFGDNGREAENWSVNLLHPYAGNVSLIGDALKLHELNSYPHKGLMVIGYEHSPPKVDLEPLLQSFELIAAGVMDIPLGSRVEERRGLLVHPEHQVLLCVGWELNEASKALRPQPVAYSVRPEIVEGPHTTEYTS